MERAKLGHRLGEGGITFHSLRHCFGTAMAAQGVPMRTLQELMGHRDFSTTLIYADYAPSAHEAEWAEKAFTSSERSADRRPETGAADMGTPDTFYGLRFLSGGAALTLGQTQSRVHTSRIKTRGTKP
jgi:hypothetical protein